MNTKEMIGRKVRLNPSWRLRIHANILSADEHGLYFKITQVKNGSSSCAYKKGQTIFFSHSYGVVFTTLEE